MIATHKALKQITFKSTERPKVYIAPIKNRKFKQLKEKQKNRMVYEDYTYLNNFGGKF